MNDGYDDEFELECLEYETKTRNGAPSNVFDLLGRSRANWNWTPPPLFNPKPLLNPDRMFTTGGLDMYALEVHNSACRSRNYGAIIEPQQLKKALDDQGNWEDRSETSLLPSLALSMTEMLFWESTKSEDYHNTIDLDNATPAQVEAAMCSYLLSVAKRKHAFRDVREYANNNSACCVVGVGRIIASFRRKELIPPDLSGKLKNKPGEDEGGEQGPMDPDKAKEAMDQFKGDADKADITKDIKDVGELMEEIKEAQEAMDSVMGGKPPGDVLAKQDLEMLDLIIDQGRDITRFLRDVGDLVGHFGTAKKKTQSYTGTVVPGHGGDFTMAQPHELAMLKTPMKNDAYYRASIGALSVYNHVMRDNGNGPVYIAVDCSCSMSGKEIDFAKAMAAAAAIHCIRENRPVKIAAFNRHIASSVDLTDYLDKSTRQRMALALTAAICARGGTNFEPVQDDSVEFCRRYKGRADMLMITDGFGDYRKAKHDDARVFCVFTGWAPDDDLKKHKDVRIWVDMCEKTAFVVNTSNEENVKLTIGTLSRALDKS